MKAGWKTVKLGEASELLADGDWIESKDQSDDGIRLIQTGNIGDGLFKDREEKARYISESTFKRLRCTEIFEGDCLVSRLPEPVGRSCILPSIPRSITAVDCSIIRFKQNLILPEYFCYFSQSRNYQRLVESKTSGTTRKRISRSHLSEIEIPLPPLAEQKRIVALLDEAFAGIDEAKAKAEDNALGAKRAFQSILETLLSPTATGWTERKLDDLCVIKGRIGYRGYTKNDLVEKGHGAITLSPSNIKQNRFVADDCTYISWFKYDESPEIMVFEGDILFVKTGSTYGKVAIARDLPEKATINPQFVVLKEMKCNNWFLYYSMTTNSFRGGVECIVGGAATPTISQANLGELTIHVPSIGTQETIVKQLDAAHEAATLLGALYEQKVTALNELKSSLLTQAFAGELTA